jgi:hypothetical protein
MSTNIKIHAAVDAFEVLMDSAPHNVVKIRVVYPKENEPHKPRNIDSGFLRLVFYSKPRQNA